MTARNLPIGGTARMVEVGMIITVGRERIRFHPLLHNLVPINRRGHTIICAVKNNCGDDTSETTHGGKSGLTLLNWIWPSLEKSFTSIKDRRYGAIFCSRMDADGCEDIWVGCAQDNRHRSTGRDACDIDSMLINRPLAGLMLNFLYNPGNNGGFPTATKLIRG